MIRFIMKRSTKDELSGATHETLHTLDVDAPEVEEVLTKGGMSQDGYDFYSLVGVEVLHPEPTKDPTK